MEPGLHVEPSQNHTRWCPIVIQVGLQLGSYIILNIIKLYVTIGFMDVYADEKTLMCLKQ